MPSLIEGLAAPFPHHNVDTDVIMPKRFLRTITREGLAEGVFSDLRFTVDGTQRPEFVLNRPEFANSALLVVGDNFGCGSSREHAVWGLKQLGIRAIIGTSFAGIFYDNARKNGLALAMLKAEDRDGLLDHLSDQPQKLTFDIKERALHTPIGSFDVEIDTATHTALVEDRNELSDSLGLMDDIRAFEAKRPESEIVSVSK
ncbi:3-isopropylmalate dehydratase small subunit [Ruegeria sp. HKCCD7255]|uniref:3-isopropylmalate dehydratase small subunit n=1 Tax=Ruegeria sp. HKCCD7255 TaxID=2683004 RepID=UPI0014897453|nr:3-isopropylmalate dehydratase small subunit [Ruegeria sp. HKCCD7255]